MNLDELPKGTPANVTGFSAVQKNDVQNSRIIAKLREIGFAEGDEVELLHTGVLLGAPKSFRLNRTLIALRRNEAALVEVAMQAQAAE